MPSSRKDHLNCKDLPEKVLRRCRERGARQLVCPLDPFLAIGEGEDLTSDGGNGEEDNDDDHQDEEDEAHHETNEGWHCEARDC